MEERPSICGLIDIWDLRKGMKGVRTKILPFGGNAMGSQELGGLLDFLYVASHIVD